MNTFISYSWSNKDFVDEIDTAFGNDMIRLIRDVRDLKKLDNINEFTKSLETMSFIIIVINDSFLKSANCMEEIVQIVKLKNFHTRIIPLLQQDTRILKDLDRLVYIDYWEKELEQYEKEIKSKNIANRSKLVVKMEDTRNIISSMNTFLDKLSYINLITFSDSNKTDVVDKLKSAWLKKVYNNELRLKVQPKREFNFNESNYLCVDFGTSYSVATIADENGRIHLVPDANGRVNIPSIIEVNADGTYKIGTSISNRNQYDERIYLSKLKRCIGKKKHCKIGKSEVSLKVLISMILHSIKLNASAHFNVIHYESIISVPTDYGITEIQFLLDCFKLAGYKVFRVVQESTIAPMILSDKYYHTDGSVLSMCIDLGGGTFDISVLEVGDGVFEVVRNFGNKRLGSVDFDQLVFEYLIDEIREISRQKNLSINESLLLHLIRYEAELIKIKLQTHDSETVYFELIDQNSGNLEVVILSVSRKKYEEITKGLITKISNHFDDVKSYLINNNLGSNFDTIVLSGQGSKLYIIEDLITENFSYNKLIKQYQESAVAIGLAEHSRVLNGIGSDNCLLLNMGATEICVECAEILEDQIFLTNDSRANLVCIKPSNTRKYPILKRQTIPTKSATFIMFKEDTIKKLKIYEKSLNNAYYNELLCLSYDFILGEIYQIVVDVDSCNNIMISIIDSEGNEVYDKGVMVNHTFSRMIDRKIT